MNPATVTISVIDGLLRERRYMFNKPKTCVVGRAFDCEIHLPPDAAHMDVSRHHCLMEVDPPQIRVWDLGSTNGTYVNGAKIGDREPPANPADTEPDEGRPPRVELHDGDEVRVGEAVLLIRVWQEVEAEEQLQPVFFPPVL